MTSGNMLDQLKRASAAEEFFSLLEVAYDEKVMNVARLHILRMMAQYLVRENFEGLSDEAVAQRCKAVLERAYADFVSSSPLDHRVFKVLKEAVAPPKQKSPSFVQINLIK